MLPSLVDVNIARAAYPRPPETALTGLRVFPKLRRAHAPAEEVEGSLGGAKGFARERQPGAPQRRTGAQVLHGTANQDVASPRRADTGRGHRQGRLS